MTGKSLHHDDDQAGDKFFYILCNKVGPSLGGKEVRDGRKQVSFLNQEIIAPTQSLQADRLHSLSHVHSESDSIFSNVQSRDVWSRPLRTFKAVLFIF